jgi:hypothetical protein
MDLTPLQRKAAFVVIVLALAGLGVFLLVPGSPAARGQPRGSHRPAATLPPPATAPAVGTSPAATNPPAAGGTPGAPVNIYRWLPFSQAGLAAAAAVVRSFTTDYATYRYTESAAGYVGLMRGLVTGQLSATLARGYATPGLAQQRVQQKKSATGTGQITALRAFGPASLIFVVTVTQQTTSTQGKTRLTTDYAVTVTGAGTHWQVSDIELASAGNS